MTGSSDRPRVFDPDTGETLGAADSSPASPPGDAVPAGRWPWTVTAVGVVIALIVGAAGGVSWQRHHASTAQAAEVNLTVRLATSDGLQVVSQGQELVPVAIENDGAAPVIVTGLELKGNGLSGRTAQRTTIAPNASIGFNVPIAVPCAGADIVALTATIAVTTADGKTQSVQRNVVFGSQTLTPTCAPAGDTSTEPTIQATVAGFTATATGFIASLRLTLPKGQPPTPVTITAPPFTADPATPVTLTAGQPRTATVAVTPKNACFRSDDWDGLPTSFTVNPLGGNVSTSGDVLFPYALYRGVLHDLDVMCPASGTS